ncbi:hypothetical protein R1flu_009237 [Riccia fluitans]|uniref:CCHC-type domain-containing protein n=1 Tax=Riccia fluitans TaxID=41844 RepID=A0ABD1Z1R9_9MARC
MLISDKTMEDLLKSFEDLKVQLVKNPERRKSPSATRPNLWCTNCGKPGHANTEFYNNSTFVATNSREWVLVYEPNYFVETKAGVYSVTAQDGAIVPTASQSYTRIPPMQIQRYVPKQFATNIPQRKYAPGTSEATTPKYLML